MNTVTSSTNELTKRILATAIEVHRDKGPGLVESIYEWCLLRELELQRIQTVTQKAVLITYKGASREEPLRFDILVEDLPGGNFISGNRAAP